MLGILRTIAHGSSEGVKLRILAQKASKEGVMTDEEYESGIRRLAAESVMQASDADLEAWLASRATARQGKATLRGQAWAGGGKPGHHRSRIGITSNHPGGSPRRMTLDALHLVLRRGDR